LAFELARTRAPTEYARPLCVVKLAEPTPIVSGVDDVAA
jgi:hypothetical protein